MDTFEAKRPYERPRLVRVELRPEQAVLGVCSLFPDDSAPEPGGTLCMEGGPPKSLTDGDTDSAAS